MKQYQSDRKRTVSGFTLLEMVIVIGIISILLGVLVPTMRTYMTKSRLNTANSNAKVIFNSLQTIMQEYEFQDRSKSQSFFYGASDPKAGAFELYSENGEIQSLSGVAVNDSTQVNANDLNGDGSFDVNDLNGTLDAEESASRFGTRVTRLYPDNITMSWCARIEGYSVRGVLCATSNGSRYIGGYPTPIRERDMGAYNVQHIIDAPGLTLEAYCTASWAVTPPGDGEG